MRTIGKLVLRPALIRRTIPAAPQSVEFVHVAPAGHTHLPQFGHN
jgi:hypothetical protein